MEDLHAAAFAYYNNGSLEQQNLAWQFFRAIDFDGNGRVSFQEYTDFLCRTSGLAWVRPEMFRGLDRNGDGQLDFWEVLTLYYVAKTRTISCRTCHRSLHGLYFTCVTCFDVVHSDTFDLCVNCYGGRNYSHMHGLFLDSYVLLRAKRILQDPQPCANQNLAPQQPLQQQLSDNEELDEPEQEQWAIDKRRIGWRHMFYAMEVGLTVGSWATFCTIM